MKKLYMKPETATIRFEGNTLLVDSLTLIQGDPEDQESSDNPWPDRPDKDGILWGE